MTAMRMRSCISWLDIGQVEAYGQLGAAVRARLELENAAKRLDAATQSRQSKAARLRWLPDVRDRSVIGDHHLQQSVVATCAERLTLTIGMAEGVVEAFLSESIQANLQRRIDGVVNVGNVAIDGRPGAPGVTNCGHFQCLH